MLRQDQWWVPVDNLFPHLLLHLPLALTGIGIGLVVDWHVGRGLTDWHWKWKIEIGQEGK